MGFKKEVISDKELAKYAIRTLFNFNQWSWPFFVSKLLDDFGQETVEYAESLRKEDENAVQ